MYFYKKSIFIYILKKKHYCQALHLHLMFIGVDGWEIMKYYSSNSFNGFYKFQTLSEGMKNGGCHKCCCMGFFLILDKHRV